MTSNGKCTIAVDAMGGDYAPLNAVVGAADAAELSDKYKVLLIGRTNEIENVLDEKKLNFNRENIVHAEEVIGMSEIPTAALKTKKESSIVIGSKLVKDKKADAFVSAGNTGAMMAASTLLMGRIKGVGRPVIGATFPAESGSCTVYDVGASVDSKPRHLVEFAILADIFAKEIQGIPKPTVALLSVGEEESKGNQFTLMAHELLKESKVNFIGNVEGRDILKGKADIVVTDGFVGNVILKFGESMLGLLKAKFKDFADESIVNKIRVLLAKGTVKKVLKDLDYQSQGGVPLLGVNGISIIGHGSSSPLAIKNMILRAKEMYDRDIINKFEESIKDYANI
jgi:glycerol-3-phosphate acyltransferase PlsX